MRLKHVLWMLLVVVVLVAGPALGQETDPRDRTLTVDNFSLTFHRAIVRNAMVTEYAGDPPDQGPGFSDAPHVAITLYNETDLTERLVDTLVDIRIYRVDDLQDYPFLMEQAKALETLVDEQPDLAAFEAVEAMESNVRLPYVPVLPHGQLIRARAAYVETEQVQGIRYITYSNAAREPLMSNVFSYTFQGLSADGTYYISATMPLETSLFPSEPGNSFDPVAFEATWPDYLAESIKTLNEAEPEDFEPALGVLEGLVETFVFSA